MKNFILLVAVLVMVLGSGSLATAQPMQQDTSPTQDPSQTTTNTDTQSPAVSTDQSTPPPTSTPSTPPPASDQPTPPPTSSSSTNPPTNDQSTLPCGVELFRLEQQQLVQSGYPAPVSQRARECEQLGYVNPYPAPFVLGTDGTVYSYDPIEGQYYYVDPNTGIYYVVDLNTSTAYPYDPVSGTYL